MLRILLEQRFHLKLRRETRTLPVYALEAAKGGPKFKPAASPGTRSGPGVAMSGRVRAINATLPAFADLLGKVAGRPVIDATGIAGIYDFELNYSPDPVQVTLDSPPMLFAALRDQLGLALVKRDMPIDMLVVDSAGRAPTEN